MERPSRDGALGITSLSCNLPRLIDAIFSGWSAIRAVRLENNQLDQAAVDAIIEDLYNDRAIHTYSGTESLDLYGANAAASSAACAQRIRGLDGREPLGG